MRKKLSCFLIIIISIYSYAQTSIENPIIQCFNKLDYADSVHYEYMGYRNSFELYKNVIPNVLIILDNSEYSIFERCKLLERLYISQHNFANDLNYMKNPMGIFARYFKLRNLDESQKESVDYLLKLGIGALPYNCENTDMYFSPNTTFFLKYANLLNDSAFIDYLKIKELEDRYYYPKTERYRCEGDISPKGVLKFILLYEDFLKTHPNSRFLSTIYSRYGEISSIFVSSTIFVNPHSDLDKIYKDVLSTYKEYLNEFANGYLATIIKHNIEVLEFYSELFSFEGNYEEKKRLLEFLFPNL